MDMSAAENKVGLLLLPGFTSKRVTDDTLYEEKWLSRVAAGHVLCFCIVTHPPPPCLLSF